MPHVAPRFPIEVSSDYLDEMRARVKAVGAVQVAAKAKMGITTIWRATVAPEQRAGRAPNLDALERIRHALMDLEPDGAVPMPPAVVSVRGAAHHRFIAMADRLTDVELTIAADAATSALAAAAKRPRRK